MTDPMLTHVGLKNQARARRTLLATAQGQPQTIRFSPRAVIRNPLVPD
jgi:hypothetical protein